MSEKKKRKVHTPEFKAKVGLEALKGVKTINEIGQELLNSSYNEVSHSTYQAFLNINASVASFFAIEQRVESSRKLLDASIVSRKAGLRTTADVLRADQSYHAALFELSVARYNYLYNKLALAAVAGKLEEDNLQAINQLFSDAG